MKTVETDADARTFLETMENTGRREDAAAVMAMMERITAWPPRMWGDSIIGFGAYVYTRADGSRHRYFRTGFSPRKLHLVVYLMPGVKRYAKALKGLGPHRHSVSCLYLGRLKNIDSGVLEEVIRTSVKDMADLYPA